MPTVPTPKVEVVWTAELEATSGSDLVLTSSQLAVIAREGDAPSRLVAYRRDTGQASWTATATGWTVAVGSETDIVGLAGGRLLALDERTGQRRWEIDPAGADRYVGVAGGWIVAAGATALVTVASEAGALVWRREGPSASATPIIAGSLVVAGLVGLVARCVRPDLGCPALARGVDRAGHRRRRVGYRRHRRSRRRLAVRVSIGDGPPPVVPSDPRAHCRGTAR